MKFKNVPIGELKEHPKNKEYFRDIREISEDFWETFKENVSDLGFVEPLVVNGITMEVISGNQRLKAARELDMSTVPCVMVNPDDGQELRMMISSNVMRRELDPFTLFEYIAMMRRGNEGSGSTSVPGTEVTVENLAKQLGKQGSFVSTADIWNTLTEEQQNEIKGWFYTEGKEPTQKELIEEVRRFKEQSLTADKTIAELQEAVDQRLREIKELKKAAKEGGERKAEDIRNLKTEIGMLRFYEQSQERGALAGYQIESPYIQLGAEGILFDFLAMGGAAQIFMADTESWQYAPYDARFTFYFRGDLKLSRGLLLTVGWEHECYHPTLTLDRPDVGFLYGGGDTIYARVTAKIGGKP